MKIEQAYLFYNIYLWLSGVVYSYLPLTIIVVCNVLILVGLLSSGCYREVVVVTGWRREKLHRKDQGQRVENCQLF